MKRIVCFILMIPLALFLFACSGQSTSINDGIDWTVITKTTVQEYVPMGAGKMEPLKRIVQDVFDLDVGSFDYISEGELLDMSDANTLPEYYYPILAIRNDIYIAAHEGDHLPLGYLWKGNEIVTVAEQTDGSVNLFQFHTIPSSQLKSSDNLHIGCAYDDSPVYYTEIIESRNVDQTLLNELYKEQTA